MLAHLINEAPRQRRCEYGELTTTSHGRHRPRRRGVSLCEARRRPGHDARHPRRQSRRTTRPADLGRSRPRWLAKAFETTIHLGLYVDETGSRRVHLAPEPRAHWLEAWGDGRSVGRHLSASPSRSIEPLFGGSQRRTARACSRASRARATPTGRTIVKRYVRRVACCTVATTRILWRARCARRWPLPDGSDYALALLPAVERVTRPRSRSARALARPAVAACRPPPTASRSICSAARRTSSTAASRTTAGCRSCPTRSPSSHGTTPVARRPARRAGASASPTATW